MTGAANRERRAKQQRRSTLLKMTVVNASFDYRNAILLTHELRQCHAALLYADEVTLVSPRAALMKSADEIGRYTPPCSPALSGQPSHRREIGLASAPAAVAAS